MESRIVRLVKTKRIAKLPENEAVLPIRSSVLTVNVYRNMSSATQSSGAVMGVMNRPMCAEEGHAGGGPSIVLWGAETEGVDLVLLLVPEEMVAEMGRTKGTAQFVVRTFTPQGWFKQWIFLFVPVYTSLQLIFFLNWFQSFLMNSLLQGVPFFRFEIYS